MRPRTDRAGRLLCFAVLLAALTAAGCGRGQKWDLTSVTGTVTRGGKPLPGVEVQFLPEAGAGVRGPRTTGITDARGRYRLSTDVGEDGAVVGKHRVCLFDRTVLFPPGSTIRDQLPPDVAARLPPAGPAQEARFPESYGRPGETPLRAGVKPGDNTFDFDLPAK